MGRNWAMSFHVTLAGQDLTGPHMPGSHWRPPRTGIGSRDRMMHDLLRATGNFFPPEHKLQLMEQLSQTKRPPNFGPSRRRRDCSRRRSNRGTSTMPSTRSKSTMNFNSASLPTLGSRGTATPHPMMKSQKRGAATSHPIQMQSEIPAHTRAFFANCPQVNPKQIGKIHKNMQEKLYIRFKSTRDAFRAFDTDFSGDIDPIEFRNALRRFEVVTPQDDKVVDALFHLCNESANGGISYQEFAKWIKVPDRHDNLMVSREDPYKGNIGGMTYGDRANCIRQLGLMCE